MYVLNPTSFRSRARYTGSSTRTCDGGRDDATCCTISRAASRPNTCLRFQGGGRLPPHRSRTIFGAPKSAGFRGREWTGRYLFNTAGAFRNAPRIPSAAWANFFWSFFFFIISNAAWVRIITTGFKCNTHLKSSRRRRAGRTHAAAASDGGGRPRRPGALT